MNHNTRRSLVAGNWKMNMLYREGLDFMEDLTGRSLSSDIDILIAAPYIHLPRLSRIFAGNSHRSIGAQDCSEHRPGAYTGEISAAMIRSTGASFTLIGHSERRTLHGESGALLAKKVRRALEEDLDVIFCLGEHLEEREQGKAKEVVGSQLQESLASLTRKDWSRITIAYEPVWAIGTGKNASPEEAGEMHAFIRQWLAERIGDQAGEVRILYGGSVKPSNAAELFAMEDIDGALIGGASLKVDEFSRIIDIASSSEVRHATT